MNTLLKNGYDIRVISLQKANHLALQYLPYDIISDVKEIINYAKQYKPDIKDYIGDTGIVYSDINELENIIGKPIPNTMREKGFKLAKKYDIKKQIYLLTDLW